MNTTIEQKRAALCEHLREASDLNAAINVLSWDQTTYMPPGGAGSHARHLSTLQKLAHEKATDPAIGRLLDDLQPYADQLQPDHDDAALIRVARRNYERLVKVPSSFAAAFASLVAQSYSSWVEARPANDFARVQPYLERTLEMSREMANFFPGYAHIADPLIDMADYGMSVATIRPLFARLREALAPLVKAIAGRPQVDDACLGLHYPEAQQWQLGEAIIREFGYDFNRGRQDKTHHPFMTAFASGDVRITTRIDEQNLGDGLFSTLHEAGHALYEQGINPAYEGTPLGGGTSAGVHESQSRLWENIVGRSAGCWEHFYPLLRATFPDQLGAVSEDTFYRAVNKVQPSLIRTDADEVTYNLHVIIRFELEMEMLEGKLRVADLPEAWHARYLENLGLRAADDRDGVLQDVHWFSGTIGGSFQGYTLGNIMASQFYAAALKAHPAIPQEIGQGRFHTLHTWLGDNIYWHGSKFTAAELLERVTGSHLTVQPYLAYLHDKYRGIYGL